MPSVLLAAALSIHSRVFMGHTAQGRKRVAAMSRILAILAFLPLALFAARIAELPSLPEGALPNSEVVTNVVLTVDLARLDRLSFSLALDASASNSVSVAVGAAAGERLTIEEQDFEWGYDCGRWFRADTASGRVDEWPEAGTGRVSRTLTIGHRDFNPAWNRVRVVKRGLGELNVSATTSVENKRLLISIK